MELDDLADLEFPGVARLGPNGTLLDLAYFDQEQRDDALTLLEEWWAEANAVPEE